MRTKRLFRPELKQRNSEKGAALITAIFALLLVTLLGVALTSIGETARTVSHNDRENTEALYISEAGLTHALKLMDDVPGSDFTSILKAGNGAAGDGDELSTRPNGPIPAGGLSFGAGNYRVTVSDDNDETIANDPNTDTNQRIVITSIGSGRNGATATVEAIIGVTSAPALLVEGKLKISGNPQVEGSGGSAHANDVLDIDGNPCFEQYVSSATSIIDADNANTGAGCSGDDARASQEKIPLPNYDPNDAANASLRSSADYVLSDDGKVFNKSGVQIADASGGKWEVVLPSGDKMKWDWNSGNKEWKLSGDYVVEGTYYADGSNINISGNPGSKSVTQPKVTLIAEGYLDISGNPDFAPSLTYGGVKISMIAGTDLVMSGNPSSGESTEGLHYATAQLKISGNPNIHGQVMSANLNDADSPGGKNPVDLKPGDDFVVISGNPTITYTLGAGVGVPTIVSWREVRN